MNELGYQRLILKAVTEVGGCGWKLSNKFLVGIPDLVMSMPWFGTSFWEVKMAQMPKKIPGMVKWKCTKLQLDTLQKLNAAGARGGFIVIAKGDRCDYIALYRTQQIGDTIVRVPSHDFLPLERGKREERIIYELQRGILNDPDWQRKGSGQDRTGQDSSPA